MSEPTEECKRTFVVETARGFQRVTVPESWRAKSDKGATNGESFSLKFEDEDGFEAARFNAVTLFYREDADLGAVTQRPVIPPAAPRAMDGGSVGRVAPKDNA